jgi:hypothetical protein
MKEFLRRLFARFRAWQSGRQALVRHPEIASPFPSFAASIARDVTPSGVRIYSLCGVCGARLDVSATLCDECAVKQSRSVRPY